MIKKTIHPLLFSMCVLLPTACATHTEESSDEPGLEDSIANVPREVEPTEIDDSIDTELAVASTENVPEIGTEEDEINKTLKDGIPPELNEKVEEWIQFFTKRNGEAFQRFMDRGEPYKKMIVATLREHGLPSEIYYLAMIESGFVLHAKSPMAAMGFWQFIPGTGKRYGLRVDPYVDERRDPWRSTVAASMYLSDLNNVFDSWYLAMAAYNAGEMRIMNAIMRGKSRDFMSLVKGKFLPPETMDYIPKFLAAFIIGTNPEKYGFRRPQADAHEPVSLVAVPAPLPLAKVAEVTGVSLESLQRFNPHLKTGITPPGSQVYKIWVPQNQKSSVAEAMNDLTPFRLSIRDKAAKIAVEEARDGATRPKFHRVRRGENLAMIADKYGVPVNELMTSNNLRSSRIFVGRKLKLPGAAAAVAVEPASVNASKTKIKAGVALGKADTLAARKAAALASLKSQDEARDGTYYKVQRGDNLQDIARRFRVTIQELKKMNNLRRSDLRIGQILIVGRNNT